MTKINGIYIYNRKQLFYKNDELNEKCAFKDVRVERNPIKVDSLIIQKEDMREIVSNGIIYTVGQLIYLKCMVHFTLETLRKHSDKITNIYEQHEIHLCEVLYDDSKTKKIKNTNCVNLLFLFSCSSKFPRKILV